MTRLASALRATSLLAIGAPAFAQDHSMHGMPGMSMPAPAAPKPAAKKPAAKKSIANKPVTKKSAAARPAARKPSPMPSAPPEPSRAAHDMPAMDQSGHAVSAEPAGAENSAAPMNHGATDHSQMPGMDMSAPPLAGHDSHGQNPMVRMEMTGTALPAGNAPTPPVPHDHYADRDFPPAEMAKAREAMMHEQGAKPFGQLLLNIFEYQAHSGRDGYRWDGEAWYGGDISRLWVKSEGEGEFGRSLDSGEVQLLYSRAVGPYFNLQAGVRQDLGHSPRRTYATIGFEGLAPGFFETEGAVFISNKGDVLGRIEGYYDQRITQRLIFQPRLELNLSAQDIPENRIGAGIVDIELGGRLRYELSRQFAPYVGVSYLRKTGDTARLSRLAGEDVHATSVVVGVRFWF